MPGTQTVTVVFTDLVGSTALLSRVGEERAEALRREHFGILRDGIALTGCREVKNLGDGLMIVAESAAQGAAYSVAIQQAFELRNRRADEPLLVARRHFAWGCRHRGRRLLRPPRSRGGPLMRRRRRWGDPRR